MKKIHVNICLTAPISWVWECWTNPVHIMGWNHASEDWHCPNAENDLRDGGSFCYTMAAKDGSVTFDFKGKYIEIIPEHLIYYVMEDGRECEVGFKTTGNEVEISETFDPEMENSIELQQEGWQCILNYFGLYVQTKMK